MKSIGKCYKIESQQPERYFWDTAYVAYLHSFKCLSDSCLWRKEFNKGAFYVLPHTTAPLRKI